MANDARGLTRHLPGSSNKTACGLDMAGGWKRYDEWACRRNITIMCKNCLKRRSYQEEQKRLAQETALNG